MPPTVTGTVLDGIISGVLEDLHERQLMVTSDNLREATELVACRLSQKSSGRARQTASWLLFMTLPHWLISTAPVEPLLSAF